MPEGDLLGDWLHDIKDWFQQIRIFLEASDANLLDSVVSFLQEISRKAVSDSRRN